MRGEVRTFPHGTTYFQVFTLSDLVGAIKTMIYLPDCTHEVYWSAKSRTAAGEDINEYVAEVNLYCTRCMKQGLPVRGNDIPKVFKFLTRDRWVCKNDQASNPDTPCMPMVTEFTPKPGHEECGWLNDAM